jgi:hypothetical protein
MPPHLYEVLRLREFSVAEHYPVPGWNRLRRFLTYDALSDQDHASLVTCEALRVDPRDPGLHGEKHELRAVGLRTRGSHPA